MIMNQPTARVILNGSSQDSEEIHACKSTAGCRCVQLKHAIAHGGWADKSRPWYAGKPKGCASAAMGSVSCEATFTCVSKSQPAARATCLVANERAPTHNCPQRSAAAPRSMVVREKSVSGEK
jgi:hypothetical protein